MSCTKLIMIEKHYDDDYYCCYYDYYYYAAIITIVVVIPERKLKNILICQCSKIYKTGRNVSRVV